MATRQRDAGWVAAGIMAIILGAAPAAAQEPKLGDVPDGTRAVPVHIMDLLDEEGSTIRPDDDPLMPFSTEATCGECHNYQTIAGGWHFNAADPEVPPGRPGQPWILVDRKAATQIPLSYRAWPGTFRPDEVGLAPLEFVEKFGSHMPGGGIGEDEDAETPDYFMRWMVSGKLEVNCLGCHDAEPSYDQAEYAVQIGHQNFRWAATAASGLATVSGSAEDMPDTYDVLFGSMLDDPKQIPPSVSYDASRFDAGGKVFFDVVRDIRAERCYFCHSSKTIPATPAEKWESDEDIHMVAGMTCVDCHRNGLDHAMTRGYAGEALALDNPFAATLTCRGCHLGDGSDGFPTAGRLGSPQPDHAGIPPVHFEKLTCTSCHSGPWPAEKNHLVKTSKAHRLGARGVPKADDALPHILSPVFIKQGDGTIAPHKLFWPAFWATLNGDDITPLDPEVVGLMAGQIITRGEPLRAGSFPALTDEQIAQVLAMLAAQPSADGTPVYISGGKLFRLDGSGGLTQADHPAARPYSWAFAHDVRPAAQSLGVRGCSDCHATNAPFYFGRIDVDSPVAALQGAVKTMTDFQDLGSVYPRVFALSFMFRPWLKVLALAAFAVMAAVLLVFGFRGLSRVLEAVASTGKRT